MKLAVITPTCRSNPRYAEMARTLFASFRRAPKDTQLEWIIVDERLWWVGDDDRMADVLDAIATLPDEAKTRLTVHTFAPPPSSFRGPDVSDPLPAHNTARNAGLQALSDDAGYVIMLSDCTAVTADWITVALELASKGFGWKCKATSLFDHVVPKDEPMRYQDCWDALHPVRAETVAGPCWGVPREAMIACGGFDSDYDGEDDLYDQEVLLRLARVGVSFVTTRRAGVVRMNRTRLKVEVTTRSGSLRATRNLAYYQQLKLDRDRVLPGASAAAGRVSIPGRGASHGAARPAAPAAQARVAKVGPPRAQPNPAGRVRPGPAPAPAAAHLPDPARAGDDLGLEADGTAAGALTAVIEGSVFDAIAHGQPHPINHRLSRALGTPIQERDLHPDDQDPPMPTTPPARPMTVHERAVALKEARKQRSLAEAQGTAPPLEDSARCAYIPTQGGHKGMRCEGKRAHGGGHRYAPLAPVAAPPAPPRAVPPKVAIAAPAVPREPPEPPPAVAAARDKVDEHILAIQQLLADRPGTVAKNVVMVAAVLRREGILADQHTFSALIRLASPPELDDLDYEAGVGLVMKEVVAICALLPAMPISVLEFRSLNAYARVLDHWRKQTGLQVRADLSIYDRGYAAAADAGIDIAPPDDLRSLDDELANLERAIAAGEDGDDIQSVEPLTDEQVAANEAAAQAEMDAILDPGPAELDAVADLLGESVPAPGSN